MKKVLYCALVFGVLTSGALAQSAQISFQGLLTDTGGSPLAGPVQLTFRLYPDLVGGTQFFAETHPSVPLTDGVFSVSLGSISTLLGKDFSRDVYLGIQVNGESEMTPRTLLSGAPAAMTLVVPAEVKGTVSNNPVMLVENKATSGTNYGIFALNSSNSGRAVYGRATHTTGENLGLYGRSDSQNGVGVRGYASAGSGASIGVSGESVSDPNGIGGYFKGATGVKGEGGDYGVWGETSVSTGFGVVGITTATSGANNGIWGKSASSSGIGVSGEASSTSGSTYGVKGTTPSGSGIGVEGYASANDGSTRGISGRVNSPAGHAGYFSGGWGVYVTPRLGINVSNPSYPIHVGNGPGNGYGAHVTVGGTWTDGSSRAFKQNLRSVSGTEVLERVVALPVYRWEYIGSDEGDHLGPVAEDFFEAFGLGDDERYISGVDGDGVALAAIKGLYELVSKQQEEIERMRAAMKRAGVE